MDNLNTTPTPTPNPTISKGLIGIGCAVIGWFMFGFPLAIAAIILGFLDTPKTPWSYISIVAGIAELLILINYFTY